MTGLDGKKGITEIFFCGSLWRFQGTKNTDSDTRKTPKKKSDKKVVSVILVWGHQEITQNQGGKQ